MQYRTILSLCDYSGAWSQPYRDAGYTVIQVDIKHDQDVRLLPFPGRVHGILAAPPCTHLASSGARWWAAKGEAALLESLAVADACLRFVALGYPAWWVLENPIGRLAKFYGKPAYTFDPCDYGDLASTPEAYTKRTCLWGNFTAPLPVFVGRNTNVSASEGSKIHKMTPSPDRATLRSVTPSGFARAFFLCNP
jgi:hypothetical protein